VSRPSQLQGYAGLRAGCATGVEPQRAKSRITCSAPEQERVGSFILDVRMVLNRLVVDVLLNLRKDRRARLFQGL